MGSKGIQVTCERAQRAGNHIGAGTMPAAPLTAPALSLRPKKPSHPSASVGGLKVFPSASLYMHFASCVYEDTLYRVVPLVQNFMLFNTVPMPSLGTNGNASVLHV